MTIREAFVIYESRALTTKTEKTRRNHRSICNSICRALGEIPIELVGDEQLVLWNEDMTLNGCTGTTRRANLMKFRFILTYFKRYGVISYDAMYFELPKNDTLPRTYLTPAEITALIVAAKNDRDKAIIACTFLTGCRISEILNLNREDVEGEPDEQQRLLVTVQGKNGKYRDVMFNRTAQHYLQTYLNTRDDRYRELFISGQNRRITVSRVEQVLHECARSAGLEKRVTPHILRHSFATDLLNNKAPLYDVSKSLGHANIATTANIYGHYDVQSMKRTLSTYQSKIAAF